MIQVNVYLFGYPRIERDGAPADIDTRKAVALAAYLLLSRAPQSRETLATLLWPDYDPVSARGALRRTLSVLNKATGEHSLLIDRERVQARPGAGLWCDVVAFEDLLAQAASAEPGQTQLCLLEEAIKLARDRFMAGFSLRDSSEFDEWQVLQTERLARELGQTLQKLSQGLAEQGRYEPAIAAARQWLNLDPLLEEAHRLLIRLYALDGQRGAALRQYRDCVRVLEQELGVPPLAETTALYQAVLENRLTPEHAQQSAHSHEVPPASSPMPQPTLPTLVGRDRELDALWQSYMASRAGLRWVALEGEAGIGKSRLAAEHLARVRAAGGGVFELRCFEGETHLSYGPLISGLAAAIEIPAVRQRLDQLSPAALAEAARLLPGLERRTGSEPTLPSLEGPGAQTRLFDSLRQVISAVLSASPPGVLFLDDLQWIDAASLDLFAFLLRRWQAQPIQVLATWRAGEITALPRLVHLLHENQRAGRLERLALGRLTETDLAGLVHSLQTPVALSPEFSRRLFEETEGLPLFAVEFLKQWSDDGETGGRPWQIPAGVRDLIRYRLEGLDETARQLLGAAAVIGRSFDLGALREVSGRSELEAITGLETLIARGLVVEQAGSAAELSYNFTHEKLRALAYEEISLARRRLLHRRAAEVLAASLARSPSNAGLVARHYQAAGQELQAAGYFRQAGDYARALYASTDAIAQYQAALACGHPHPAGLHEEVGDLQVLIGDYSAALASYETAASFSVPAGLPALEHKLGNLHARRGGWDLAESHYQAALDTSQSSGLNPASVLADWSQTAFQRGQARRAVELASRALAQARAATDPLVEAQAHNKLGILARAAGDASAALEHLQQALRLSEQVDHPAMRIAALNNLAGVFSDAGQIDHAIRLNQQALDLCARIGDRHREAALLNNLADLYHLSGDPSAAMLHLRRAVTIFAEVGGEAGALQPAIWDLTEW